MARSRICSVAGCRKLALPCGWCRAHYMRWWRHGDLQSALPVKNKASNGEPQRFIQEVAVQFTQDACLLWPFGQANYGYGEVWVKGRKRLAHRLVCEMAHGPQPSPELEVAHACGNRLCCNPRHLRWASRLENVADARRHGTLSRGERNGHTKLTEADVRRIRALAGTQSQTVIAAQFGVSRGAVDKILRRQNWAWLE